MYTVIFTAEVNRLDEDYEQLAAQLHTIAFSEFGCIDFESVCDGKKEIAISRWPSIEAIKAWHAHPLHREAQEKGKTHWYKRYSVTITADLKE